MIKNIFKKRNKNHGYTIIEMMIAISIFLIVIMIGMGSLLNTSMLNGKSRDMRSIMDNLSFIMEDMSRNIRTGSGYGGGGSQISFTSSLGGQLIYKIEPSKISKSIDNGVSWVDLSSSEIKFKNGSGFTISGALPPPGDTTQPFVTIRLIGEITSDKNIVTPFSLQTSVSQRVPDIN